MMAAATMPGLDMQAENRQLRAEIELLREDLMREVALNRKQLADFRKEMDDRLGVINQDIAINCKKRITKLEVGKIHDSPILTNHLNELVAWLEGHEATRKGLTYKEAAKILKVTPERICQMKHLIEADERLKIDKKRIKSISLA